MQAIEEIRDMTVQDLHDREGDLRRELFDLRMKLQQDASALKRYRDARRELARVLTVRNQKLKAEGAES